MQNSLFQQVVVLIGHYVLPRKFIIALLDLVNAYEDKHSEVVNDFANLAHDHEDLKRAYSRLNYDRNDYKMQAEILNRSLSELKAKYRERDTDETYEFIRKNRDSLRDLNKNSGHVGSTYIGFIKVVRQETGQGLRVTKDAVDRFLTTVGNQAHGNNNSWLTSNSDLDSLRAKLAGNPWPPTECSDE